MDLDCNLLFLPAEALKDRLFVRDFFSNFAQLRTKTLLIHGGLPNEIEPTWFLTKKISAYLSENMVNNLPFSGNTRNLLQKLSNTDSTAHYFQLRIDLLQDLWQTTDCIVINTVVTNSQLENQVEWTNAENTLIDVQEQLKPNKTLIFIPRVRSPLGGVKAVRISSREDAEQNLNAFPEDASSIELAYQLRPAFLVSAKSFIHAD